MHSFNSSNRYSCPNTKRASKQKFSTDVIERKKKPFPLEIRLMSTYAYGINHQSSFPPEFYKNIFLFSPKFASPNVKSIN